MRIMSWTVVLVSIGWLLAWSFWPQLSTIRIPPVSDTEAIGTVAQQDNRAPVHFDTFAQNYTAAWNSHDPEQVAAFYAPDGQITINGGEPQQGTGRIIAMAAGFMAAFPDIELTFDRLEDKGQQQVYHWTFTGTHAETGNRVRISGSETWRFNDAGLIADSLGQFDEEDYARQVAGGQTP